jgi:DNA-binding IclR family transcriptional regulator
MSASGKISLSGLPRGELEALAERLLAENDALRRAIAKLKAEVATLNRPLIKCPTAWHGPRYCG